MRSASFLLIAGFGWLTLPAVAQSRPGPAYFLRHPNSEHRLETRLGPGMGLAPRPEAAQPAGLPAPAAIPTVRAAAAYPPLVAAIPTVRAAAAYPPLVDAPLAATGQPPFPTQEMSRRRDLTGVFCLPALRLVPEPARVLSQAHATRRVRGAFIYPVAAERGGPAAPWALIRRR